ncbi:hypothetical protein NP493_240g05018 [Ridgeia piscesae]|uniref:TMC domain-containing protein n=1 Tax=Ridgeia piscesae TaxID=27915 RepID=A0AAD9UDI4_RIDPI|nr:hypothetical protein NP493_240g05018 [Ridgeia piscesae]
MGKKRDLSFLRWLFLVNVVIFVLMFFFATIPQLAFPDDTATPNETMYYNTPNKNIKRAYNCSALYVVDEPDNPSGVQPLIDFLLGTGWMEKKIAFYGAYKDNRVLSTSYSYNLPLAYILVVLSYFFLSLVFVVRKTANTVRDRLMDTQCNLAQYSRLAFTFWDYTISDEANSTILHKNIVRENKDLLEENQRAKDKENMSTKMKVQLWAIRIGINILVIGILALACYIVFLVKSETNYKNKTPLEQLALSFMVSLTITALNSIVPFGFKKMVPYEKYSFADEVNVTLARLIENKDWSISKIIGLQEFDIPKNILDLIYTEVLVWFGTFFAPMIPLMTVLKLVLVFYFKKLSLMYNFTPSSKTYRVGDAYFFVQIVLLGAYVVCITPIMYVVWSMSPSKGCGPFRSYDFMYETLSATIHSWPPWMEGIADFLASTAFSIPAFTTLA